jgi:hypothetical protein
MILMTLRSLNGAECDCVLLWSLDQKMRVAVPGYDDAAELNWHGGQWFAENGDPVQVRFLEIPPWYRGAVPKWVN